ncbi:MAG: hypothetical protein ACRDG6_01500 [Candidatus Limnocylindria bacterium]
MATHERTRTRNGIVRKLGILAVGASLTLAACGTSEALSGAVQTTSDRQSVLTDPDNPYWSRNTAVLETSEQRSILKDPDNPYWSHTTATAADDVVERHGPRPH